MSDNMTPPEHLQPGFRRMGEILRGLVPPVSEPEKRAPLKFRYREQTGNDVGDEQ